MSENLYAYQVDGSESEAREAGEQEAEERDAVAAAGHHPDGSRVWRFVEQADPRSWDDLTYVDEHVDEVKGLGWIQDNPQGAFWTVDDAVRAYDAYIVRATEPYRYVDDTGEYEQHESEHEEPGEPSQAPPPPLPTPLPTADQQPARSDQGRYAGVMDELRQTVPENDGRWSATGAAAFDNDTAFFAEQGITAAHDRALAATDAATGADGTVSPQAFLETVGAEAELGRAYIAADTSRNQYQQSTDFDASEEAAQRLRAVDEFSRDAHERADQDPESMGLNLTAEQQRERADVQEYMSRTGQHLDAAAPLTDEQRSWLAQVRQAEQEQAEQQQAEWEASAEGRAARAEADRQADHFAAEGERVAESRRRAEERMQTPTEERLR